MILMNKKKVNYSSFFLQSFFVVLIFISGINIFSDEKKEIFPWGKTAKEIFRLDDEQLQGLMYPNEIRKTTDVYGVSSNLTFFFSNGKSVAIECEPYYYKNVSKYQGIYDIFHKALISKYGKPTKELNIWIGGKEKKTYRNLDEAVDEGSIVRSSFWTIPNTAIYYEIYSGETFDHILFPSSNRLYFVSLPYFNTLDFTSNKSNFILSRLSWNIDPIEFQKNISEKYSEVTDYSYGNSVNSIATIDPYISTYGYKTNISIFFSQNRSQAVIFDLTNKGKNIYQTLIDYDKIESILEDYYGKPEYKKEIWPDDTSEHENGYTYKFFKGNMLLVNNALQKGKAGFISRRKTSNDSIIHFMGKPKDGSYYLNHKVIFLNNKNNVNLDKEETIFNLHRKRKNFPGTEKYTLGLNFQMKMEEIRKIKGYNLMNIEGSNRDFFIANTTFLDRNIIIWLEIDDNLRKLTYEFIEPVENKKRIESYYKLNQKMIEDLGNPTQEKLVWKDIKYRSGPDSYVKAMEQGFLRFETNWISESMAIKHTLIPEDCDPEFDGFGKKINKIKPGNNIFIKHMIVIQETLE